MEQYYLINSTFDSVVEYMTNETSGSGAPPTRRVAPVVLCVVAVLGVLGNLAVLTVVAAVQQMRSTTSNVLIAGLAVVDLLHAVTLPFTAYVMAINTWPFGRVLCKVSPPTVYEMRSQLDLHYLQSIYLGLCT